MRNDVTTSPKIDAVIDRHIAEFFCHDPNIYKNAKEEFVGAERPTAKARIAKAKHAVENEIGRRQVALIRRLVDTIHAEYRKYDFCNAHRLPALSPVEANRILYLHLQLLGPSAKLDRTPELSAPAHGKLAVSLLFGDDPIRYRHWKLLVHAAFLAATGQLVERINRARLITCASEIKQFAEFIGRIPRPLTEQPCRQVANRANELHAELTHRFLMPLGVECRKQEAVVRSTARIKNSLATENLVLKCVNEVARWLHPAAVKELLQPIECVDDDPVAEGTHGSRWSMPQFARRYAAPLPAPEAALRQCAHQLMEHLSPNANRTPTVIADRVRIGAKIVAKVGPKFAKLLRRLLKTPNQPVHVSEFINSSKEAVYQEAYNPNNEKQWDKLRAVVRDQNQTELIKAGLEVKTRKKRQVVALYRESQNPEK